MITINLDKVDLSLLSKKTLSETINDSIQSIPKLKMSSLKVLVDKELKINNGSKIVTYRIYNNGRIVKYIPKIVNKKLENKYKYVYFDKEGNKHVLGIFTIFKKPLYKGDKDKFVNLISLEEVPKYYKEGKYQYHFNVDSPRSYLNEQTLAGFFGAMFEVNYLDISCNGFSHNDGSSKPSRSHINGNNGDFKYLRKDKSLPCGKGTSLNIIKTPDSLDYERQNKWNDALYKFGWKSMLGWSYKIKGKTHYLNHITHKTKDHYHHLHVQGFEPLFKEIKE
ncbi:hypothetical protein [Flavobacterium cellulosilyticum]|uniref:Uncharacterized protein n=1 Tax=Flavobacterium cellulosilyticum TaxID=2541731 RepID=A0A4R5CEY9_9FLAO|nr:hypothetical protein [Flavobacterium cellulosilyticum]TDD96950.1 hypothetical protein E0F76_09915 [Flavobacterium cellulosilyticum]